MRVQNCSSRRQIAYQCKHDALSIAQVPKKLRPVVLHYDDKVLVSAIIVERLSAIYTLYDGPLNYTKRDCVLPQGKRGRSLIPNPIKEGGRSEEHTSELQSLRHLVCRL